MLRKTSSMEPAGGARKKVDGNSCSLPRSHSHQKGWPLAAQTKTLRRQSPEWEAERELEEGDESTTRKPGRFKGPKARWD